MTQPMEGTQSGEELTNLGVSRGVHISPTGEVEQARGLERTEHHRSCLRDGERTPQIEEDYDHVLPVTESLHRVEEAQQPWPRRRVWRDVSEVTPNP